MKFKDIHPENIFQKPEATEEEKRRLILANKLVKPAGPNKPPKKLTSAERKEIYKILTGNEYTVIKGRPSEKGRNFRVTIDFLFRMGATLDNEETIKQMLAKEYELPGCDISDTKRRIEDFNFTKIISKNINELESYLIQYIDAVDNGLVEDEGDKYNNCVTCLNGVDKYRKNRMKTIK